MILTAKEETVTAVSIANLTSWDCRLTVLEVQKRRISGRIVLNTPLLHDQPHDYVSGLQKWSQVTHVYIVYIGGARHGCSNVNSSYSCLRTVKLGIIWDILWQIWMLTFNARNACSVHVTNVTLLGSLRDMWGDIDFFSQEVCQSHEWDLTLSIWLWTRPVSLKNLWRASTECAGYIEHDSRPTSARVVHQKSDEHLLLYNHVQHSKQSLCGQTSHRAPYLRAGTI